MSSWLKTIVGRSELQDDLTRNLADDIKALQGQVKYFKALIATEEKTFNDVCLLQVFICPTPLTDCIDN